MTSQKNKIVGFIKVDHIIDLITNSSSELYVIQATMSKEIIAEMINATLSGITSVSVDSIEDRLNDNSDSVSDHEWQINQALEAFPVEAREELREKYFKNPAYYGVVFDRDWIYEQDNIGNDVRHRLEQIGFEMINGDY